MDNNKKILIALGAVVLLLLGILFGSSGNKSGSQSNSGGSQSQQDLTPVQPQVTDDTTFIGLVRSYGNPYIDNAEDSQLISIAHTVCDTFDSGFTYEEIVNYLATNGDTSDLKFYEMEGIIIGAAVNVYCPTYLGQIS